MKTVFQIEATPRRRLFDAVRTKSGEVRYIARRATFLEAVRTWREHGICLSCERWSIVFGVCRLCDRRFE